MWKVAHPQLGQVSFNGGGGYYSAAFRVGASPGVEVEIEGDPNPALQLWVARIVGSLDDLDRAARSTMEGGGGPVHGDVAFYLQHHVDEIPGKVTQLLGVQSVAEVDVKRMVAVLNINTIQITATERQQRVQFDYCLSLEDTNYLLVVWFNKSGAVEEIGVES